MDPTAHEPRATAAPVLLVIDDSAEDLRLVAGALERRFGADYRVLGSGGVADATVVLERLAREGAAVAFVAAGLPPHDGVAVLRRVHALHPGAARALLVPMSEATAHGPGADALLRALALGDVDFSIAKGWVSPEEWLHPQVQEALCAWAVAHRPRHEHLRIVGEQWSPRAHRLRDVLTRNHVPFGFYDAAGEAGRRLLAEHGADAARLPVVIRFDGEVLVDPDDEAVAAALGVPTRPPSERFDLAIVGAGPAGLAAAVYGASEGLRTLVVEPEALGGQAGTSSRIRNYLGFPLGLSGSELTTRGYEQARVFGAEFVFTRAAVGVSARDADRVVSLSGGVDVVARAVVIATGASYRRLGVPALERLVGRGVFYGAASAEARAMSGAHAVVVGAGNSAGQAALHLARFAARVTVLVRGASLAASMSDYLVQELAHAPNVEIRLRARVVDGSGGDRLEQVVVEDGAGRRDAFAAAALFVLIGAEPRTEWIADAVQRDAGGYLMTGPDVAPERWRLPRPPMLLETSLPGVFAAGDARHGSVKRVAAAVGEGSVAVGSVHAWLAERGAAATG